jgi:parallel beta-helix repeat protein
MLSDRGKGMKKAIMSIFTVWIMVSSVFVGLITFSDIENVQAPYTPHSPIRINSNAEFTSMAGLEGWAGGGSYGNPFIIESYDINGSGSGSCIYIGNTTVYFVVRDCYLHEASGVLKPPYFTNAGLTLYNVQNGTISNNNASNNLYGIYLHSSDGNTVTNNTASLNSVYGVVLASSNSNVIENNTSTKNFLGMSLHTSHSNKVANNTVSSNNGWGIHLYSSSINSLVNNTASSNKDDAIRLDSSNSNTLANNTASSNNDFGIVLSSSSSNTIGNNTASNNNFGIGLGSSNSNTLANNTVSSNSNDGIYISSSNNNIIANNTVSLNSKNSISLASSNNNIVINNTASNNYRGILVTSSSNNLIYHNNIISNTNQAYDDSINGNQWDNDYPSGGNYWSNYGGVDNFKGPNQDQPGSDGIGDTPYIIDSDSRDNYPLMEPLTTRTFDNYMVLKQGWNLISIPLTQENQSLKKVLEMIDGWYDAAQWYDITDTKDPWKHYKVGKPYGNDLSKINKSMGFWIHNTNPRDSIFLYNGTKPISNQSITLHPGWNMVGYPSLTNRNRTAALNNITFGSEVDAIWTFNTANKKWMDISAGDHFEVGKGYWVHATTDCEWEVPL